MENLEQKYLELIEIACETIKKNYDSVKYNHTVAVAVNCRQFLSVYMLNLKVIFKTENEF